MIAPLIQIQALFFKNFQEIDVKAGGGHKMTMGEVLRQWMVKLEWYSTLFPRIPVPIQKDLMQKLKERPPQAPGYQEEEEEEEEEPEPEPEREEPRKPRHIPDGEVSFGEAERSVQQRRYPSKSVMFSVNRYVFNPTFKIYI